MKDALAPDYRKILDPEVWAFIEKTNSFYPLDTYQRSIAEQREIYDRMCAAFAQDYPAGVSATDTDADGVPVRSYSHRSRKPGVTIIYAHGGGLVVGGLHSHDDICAEICAETGYDIVAVDYRLGPEFTRDDALQDMQTVLDWARRGRGGGFLTVGDSAGGFLSVGLVHGNRRATDILGQVLIYPGLGGYDMPGGSMDRHAFAPLLTRAEVTGYNDILASGKAAASPGFGMPLQDDDFSDLPPTVSISAECDPIADDARIYAEKINAAGGTALWYEDKGLVHAHLRARHMSRRARNSFDRVLRAITLIGRGGTLTRSALGD